MELNGLTALVTGGAAGIGAGIAERLAMEGMHVVVADLDERSGSMMAERTSGSFLRTDLANPADVRAAVDAAGPVAVLVNNAGGIEEPCFPAAEPAKWEQTLDLNLRAVMLATQLVLAPMAERGGGAIINIASTAGLARPATTRPSTRWPRRVWSGSPPAWRRCVTPWPFGSTASARAWWTRRPRAGREPG
jgi:NAD(P)-dependent dehydrogenase (short-subunit alcohol dehydrogenase family)